MTFEEALKALKEGKKVRRKDWPEGFHITLTSNKCLVVNGRTSGLFIDDFSEDWWEEVKEDILDDKEKEYLSAVIKPFRDKVTHIAKTEDDIEWSYAIMIRVDSEFIDDDYYEFFLPPFKRTSSMYKNMEVGKEYTLKELGL